MKEILEAAEKFLSAGLKYKEITQKNKLDVGAVLWFESPRGLVIITRSEYKDTILKNIPQVGQTYSLGGVDDTDK